MALVNSLSSGVALLSEVLQTVANASAQAIQISSMIATANAEGRTTFTDAEWATIDGVQSTARASLLAAIQKALALPA